MRTRTVAAAAFTLLLSVAAVAHEGHPHRFLGTLSAVQGSQIEVKTTDGKTVTVTLDSKTTIVRGTTKLDRTALKAGGLKLDNHNETLAGLRVQTAVKAGLKIKRSD